MNLSWALVIPVRFGAYRPGGFGPAVQQKIHHALRVEAARINPESNVRQAIEAPLDDALELVDRSAVGCRLNTGGECRSLGMS